MQTVTDADTHKRTAVFRNLTTQGIKTLSERIEDAGASAFTTADAARHAGNEKWAVELALMNTALRPMAASLDALRKDNSISPVGGQAAHGAKTLRSLNWLNLDLRCKI